MHYGTSSYNFQNGGDLLNYGDIFNGAVAAILGGVMLKIVEVLAIKISRVMQASRQHKSGKIKKKSTIKIVYTETEEK